MKNSTSYTSYKNILKESFKPKNFFKLSLKDIIKSIIAFAIITFVSIFFNKLASDPTLNIAILYTFGVFIISRITDGQIYGIIFSFASVLAVNFYFTYPFWDFNFTLEGYQVTFVGMLLLSIITSISAALMKEQNDRLILQEKALNEAEKEKMRANLLRAISHDLRTPLTGIIGNSTSYLEMEETMGKEEKIKIVKSIKDDSDWLLNMVENLLTITKFNEGETEIATSIEVIDDVISTSVLKFRKRFPKNEIRVIPPDEVLMCKMDSTLIEQVILNLLQNAVVHSETTEPILLNVYRNNENIEFHVRDYGKKIPKDKLETIFLGDSASFTNGGDSKRGMGIGLSICRTIINAHGGKIWAEYHDDGAEFVFYLKEEK